MSLPGTSSKKKTELSVDWGELSPESCGRKDRFPDGLHFPWSVTWAIVRVERRQKQHASIATWFMTSRWRIEGLKRERERARTLASKLCDRQKGNEWVMWILVLKHRLFIPWSRGHYFGEDFSSLFIEKGKSYFTSNSLKIPSSVMKTLRPSFPSYPSFTTCN